MCFSLPALNKQWKTSNSVLYDHHYKQSFSLNYLGLHALDTCPVVQMPDHLLSLCMIQCPNFSNQTNIIGPDNFVETDILVKKKILRDDKRVLRSLQKISLEKKNKINKVLPIIYWGIYLRTSYFFSVQEFGTLHVSSIG